MANNALGIRKDISGQKFGMLTAIKPIDGQNWLFRCDCGTEVVKRRCHVTGGLTKSCGCIWRKSSRPRIDIAGRRFGRLTIIDYQDGKWRCKCDCGKITFRNHQDLTQSKMPSCGCYLKEGLRVKHQKSNTNTFKIWSSMCQRCSNMQNRAYGNYGGRGIKVCDRWLGEHGFESFLADMGERPGKEYSIDRIDVNGNYEPSNCRWATRVQQANNTRKNVWLTHNGETHTLSEWCDIMKFDKKKAHRRYRSGCSFNTVFSAQKLSRRFTDEEVRFIRSFNGGYKECAAALGKAMTCATYHQIIKRKSYKDVI